MGSAFLIISENTYSDDPTPPARLLVKFDFNSTGLTKQPKNISLSTLGLNSSESLDVMISIAGKLLIATDGVKIIAIDTANLSKYW